jgi:hypothetical protein
VDPLELGRAMIAPRVANILKDILYSNQGCDEATTLCGMILEQMNEVV